MKPRVLLLALSICLGAVPCSLFAGDSAHQWLERMSAAMSQMNYQGTFVYVQGEGVETMRITHVFDDNGSRERLVSVSGSPREIVRDAEGVRWISGHDRKILADPAVSRPFFPELPLGDPSQASMSYDFRLAGKQRIAGHTGQRINILPKDEYRYGYSLWLETRSGLLLKWQLNGSRGESLAKLMFTELKMGNEVDPAELRTSPKTGNQQAYKSGLPSEGRSGSKPPRWGATELPAGFRLASHRWQEMQAGKLFEHLVYSDGLAAVSVYIESAEAAMKPGLHSMGTTHAYSRSAGDTVLTVLGDVPAVTVRLIGESMAPAAKR